MKRLLTTVAIACALVAAPTIAMADTSSVSQSGTATIGGRTFGPEADLVTTYGEVSLPKSGQRSVAGEMGIQAVTKYSFGTSFAASNHETWGNYVGSSYAAANIYQNQRVVSVCHKYTRGGKDLFAFACSNATSNGSRWTAARVIEKGVLDSPNPSAPTTQFAYRTQRISPSVF